MNISLHKNVKIHDFNCWAVSHEGVNTGALPSPPHSAPGAPGAAGAPGPAGPLQTALTMVLECFHLVSLLRILRRLMQENRFLQQNWLLSPAS